MANGMAASHDGFSGLYRLAGALALAVLTFSVSTHAAYTTLTSNSGHAVVAPSYLARAQGFTTGSDIDGYELESVELFLGLVPSSELAYELVTLHADDAGMPGDLVARFANPESLAVGWNTFHAPADTLLEADTTYYLAVNLEADAGIVFGLGVTAGTGDQSASDWSVEDMSWTLRDGARWGVDVTSVLQFSLAGAPHTRAPAPAVRSVDVAAPSGAAVPDANVGVAAAPDANVGPASATVSRVGLVQEAVSGIEPPRLFVSNAEQPQSAWSRSIMGQGFTTGSAARGYRLGSIELYLESPPADVYTMPMVTLHADESGEPGELLARFTNPDNFTVGANTFRAPFAALLDPNSTYHVVVNLAADEPQAFNLVTSGKADVPLGEPEWRVQTGSLAALEQLALAGQRKSWASLRGLRGRRERPCFFAGHSGGNHRHTGIGAVERTRRKSPPLHRPRRLRRPRHHRAHPAKPSSPRRHRAVAATEHAQRSRRHRAVATTEHAQRSRRHYADAANGHVRRNRRHHAVSAAGHVGR